MQSFRSEIENPIVQKDIIELGDKIQQFYDGKIDEEKFRSLRLARGVYGQRQFGVQMIRIKLPYGKVTSDQLLRICDVSEEYSRGRLHITTRQDIQIHYVSLDRTPELWAELEKSDVTIREACGNAVRNVTASPDAGINPEEPFDVSPYAHAVFKFFLRNPICQELGRKFKVSFSSADDDSALSYMHDIGFIAKIKVIEGKPVFGFKVMLAGGLGSQPRLADVAHEFLASDKIIPYMESILRVFDRYGERSKRAKARLKFLVKDLGFEVFNELVAKEQLALSNQTVVINTEGFDNNPDVSAIVAPEVTIEDVDAYEAWKASNVFAQKQDGLFAIGIKVNIGDFYLPEARALAALIKEYAADELRFTLRQNILVRHVREDLLPFFYTKLKELGFTDLGYESIADITACPGTDTCNLGIASSTGAAEKLGEVLKAEYPEFAVDSDLVIKISGCMNACGQHNLCNIGFQGMSIKSGKYVAPALQILLGGGTLGNGEGRIADKVIKIPSKRGPEALRLILNDYIENSGGVDFIEYYDEKGGQKYFYDFLKPLSDATNLEDSDFIDWGSEEKYETAVGVGECAGVVIDLVATLLYDSKDKLTNAQEALSAGKLSDAIYFAYSSIVHTAKAILTAEGTKTNTHNKIISDFNEIFVKGGKIDLGIDFESFVYQINQNAQSTEFATSYIADADKFYNLVEAYRAAELAE
ncbi:HEPN domain-containing protein [Wenyingzhuangia sp. 2_MG-2023]|uniref:HEPN domain-containing protein n=1 Tax=Wenyingzhuangia sp. 2_MG-2023 TaxID=3062639 RepID=UPI0026E464D9|nr:HEPN domain-containing protein [Wenyingzhuangia sp. 2_MG-2023]MDO6737973.1 HEPN domain-containing protein [Wenyingzhuangia sp. 2_MG-2023]MDO6802673.1 HEPN domain-containing protein [Wenyingzhuangia sp. 1_MG-2023]